jgi:hypothetical protein
MLELLNKTVNGINPNIQSVGDIGASANPVELVNMVINILLSVTFALSIIGIAYSFFLFILSGGDKDAVKKAKTSLTWSVVVCLLCFLVIALKQTLFNLLGVSTEFNPLANPAPSNGGGGNPPIWHPI